MKLDPNKNPHWRTEAHEISGCVYSKKQRSLFPHANIIHTPCRPFKRESGTSSSDMWSRGTCYASIPTPRIDSYTRPTSHSLWVPTHNELTLISTTKHACDNCNVPRAVLGRFTWPGNANVRVRKGPTF